MFAVTMSTPVARACRAITRLRTSCENFLCRWVLDRRTESGALRARSTFVSSTHVADEITSTVLFCPPSPRVSSRFKYSSVTTRAAVNVG